MKERHCEQSEAIPRTQVRSTKVCVFIALILFPTILFSQLKKFSSLSKYEKRWALFHPLAACKIKRHQKEMYAMYEEVKKNNLLDQYSNGGKLDAFRHTFAMAYFSRFVSVRKLRKLGKVHEKGNYLDFKKGTREDGELPDSASCAMDLCNNELGFSIGREAGKQAIEGLRQRVITAIFTGRAFIIRRNKEGAYEDCDGNIILADVLKKWNNGKCIIASNK